MYKLSTRQIILKENDMMNSQADSCPSLDTDYFIRMLFSTSMNKPYVRKNLIKALKDNHIYSRKFVVNTLHNLLAKRSKDKTITEALKTVSKKLATKKVSFTPVFSKVAHVQFIHASGDNIRFVNANDVKKVYQEVLNCFSKNYKPQYANSVA